jgi:hypothetical protein
MIRKSGSRFSETIMLQNRNIKARWRLILKLSRSRPRRLNISAAALARIDDRIDAAIDDRPSSERTNCTLLRELDAPILSHFPRSLPGCRSQAIDANYRGRVSAQRRIQPRVHRLFRCGSVNDAVGTLLCADQHINGSSPTSQFSPCGGVANGPTYGAGMRAWPSI